jgi:hypothetical protein
MRRPSSAEIESGVPVLHCGKAATQMTAASLKRKLRGFPIANLAIRVAGQ